MPQSLGALGGKPNNAYYFIGFLGKEKRNLFQMCRWSKENIFWRGNSKGSKREPLEVKKDENRIK